MAIDGAAKQDPFIIVLNNGAENEKRMKALELILKYGSVANKVKAMEEIEMIAFTKKEAQKSEQVADQPIIEIDQTQEVEVLENIGDPVPDYRLHSSDDDDSLIY